MNDQDKEVFALVEPFLNGVQDLAIKSQLPADDVIQALAILIGDTINMAFPDKPARDYWVKAAADCIAEAANCEDAA